MFSSVLLQAQYKLTEINLNKTNDLLSNGKVALTMSTMDQIHDKEEKYYIVKNK